MYPKTSDLNLQTISTSPSRITIAEADPEKIARVEAYIQQHFQQSIRVCKTYAELLPMLEAQLPDLLLLGILDRFNSFDTCQECRQSWPQLPIVLLSRQTVVDSYFHQFRKLALTKGANDVVTDDLLQLERLILGLRDRATISATPESMVSNIRVLAMLTTLREINEMGNNYFGPLAQGNYWRKSHASIIDRFPALANWSADHFGIISCNEEIVQSYCTEAEIQAIRHWFAAYLRECERIISDFRQILKNSKLSSQTIKLLLDE